MLLQATRPHFPLDASPVISTPELSAKLALAGVVEQNLLRR
jgi:hypothetical protein